VHTSVTWLVAGDFHALADLSALAARLGGVGNLD
jgi:hypothetical protein